MAAREVRLYPTPENNLNESAATVKLEWALKFLSTQMSRIPDYARAEATIKWNGPPIKYMKTTNKKEDALEILQGATTGLTQAQVAQVLALLQ